MPTDLTPKQQLVELVRQASSILVLTHANPDGDALGSSIALKRGLEKLGKQVTVAMGGKIPATFDFLPGYAEVENEFTANKDLLLIIDESQAKVGNVSLKRVSETKLMVVVTPKEGVLTPQSVRIEDGSFRTDLVIVLDCSDLDRMGVIYEENPSLFFEVPVVNIDHHPTNTNFGKVNLIDVTASSTAEILVSLLETLGKDIPGMIDAEMATCLLTGITTDTGSFQNANTTPKSLTVAAQMVAAGARQQEIVKRIFMTRSLAQLRLWGRALSYIKEDPQNHFAWTILTKADFVASQAEPTNTEGVVDELLKSAEGMNFVLLMVERDGEVKCSMRSIQPHMDVSAIALHMGGGGHVQAAGFSVKNTTIAQSEQKILTQIRDFLTKRQPAGTPARAAEAQLKEESPLVLPEDIKQDTPAKVQKSSRPTRPNPFRRESPAQDAPDLETEEKVS